MVARWATRRARGHKPRRRKRKVSRLHDDFGVASLSTHPRHIMCVSENLEKEPDTMARSERATVDLALIARSKESERRQGRAGQSSRAERYGFMIDGDTL